MSTFDPPDPSRPDPFASGRVRLRTPEDLIRAVPYLLRFRPTDSLVLIGLNDTRLLLTVRLDLSDATDPASAAVLSTTLTAARNADTTILAALVFTDDPVPPRVLPYRDLIDQIEQHAAQRGMRLADALLVHDGRWWSYRCEDPDCCPPGGRPIGDEPSSWEALAITHGIAPVASRDALAASLDPAATQASAAELVAAADALRAVMAAAGDPDWTVPVVEALLTAANTPEVEIAPAAAARWGAALSAIPVRDAVWLAIDHGRATSTDWWRRLGRMLPAPLCAAPFFLVGWDAWRAGDGALANLCVERVLAADPDYSAAQLLSQVLRAGLNPARVPRLGTAD